MGVTPDSEPGLHRSNANRRTGAENANDILPALNPDAVAVEDATGRCPLSARGHAVAIRLAPLTRLNKSVNDEKALKSGDEAKANTVGG